ncbi:Uncharacterised protein [Rothia kristinae]|nr:Uncharacterised protein [Rothia kristinae]
MSVFSFLAFGLDALAIAAQAMLGKEMGRGTCAGRRTGRRCGA